MKNSVVQLKSLNPFMRILNYLESIKFIRFFLILLGLIFISRIVLIFLTQKLNSLPDLSIYIATGQLVANGINPYDYLDSPGIRESLRVYWIGIEPGFSENIDRFNYYVSSNLPASSMLYGFIFLLFGDNPNYFRLFFVLGDVFMAFAAAILLRGKLISGKSGLYRAFLIIIFCAYPTLLVHGTVIAEDKQFQTALLILASALMIGNNSGGFFRNCINGFVLGLSVLFKFLGIFLIPLYLKKYSKDYRGFFISGISGLLTFLISVLLFGFNYIEVTSQRASGSSLRFPEHASPWVLLIDYWDDSILFYSKILSLMLVIFFVFMFIRRRLDILNLSAACVVIFLSLWLNDGAFNRLNMGFVFGLICLARVNINYGLALLAVNCAFQFFAYITLFLVMGLKVAAYDYLMAAFFVLTYLIFLVCYTLAVDERKINSVH